MRRLAARRGTGVLWITLLSTSTSGCLYYGDGSHPPSVLDEPPQDLATQCQIANRSVVARAAMPALRGRCGAWADRQTALLGI